MLYNKDKGSTRKKLGSFFGSIADRFSMDVVDLIWAVDKNDTEKVRRAMQAGLDPNRTDGIERRPLPMAIDNLNEEMIGYLLAGGADPNLLHMDGESALYKAVTWGHEPIVKMLLEAGGNPNTPTGAGVTPLQAAKKMGSQSMVNLLTNPNTATPKPEKKPKPIPKPKKKYTSPETEQAKTSATRNIALGKAAEEAAKKVKGAAQKAKEIIERKAKEAAAKQAAAKQAAAKKPVAKKTTASKPTTKTSPTKATSKPKTTTTKKATPKKKAAEVIPYIKEAGSVSGALVMAIQNDNEAAIAALLTQIKAADLNKPDKNGLTPLLVAIEQKHAKATGALIDKGADILAVSPKKEHSPLSLAVSMKSMNLVKFMVEKSEEEALKKALNNKKQLLSPQYLAYNQPKVLDVLLGAGADPNHGGKEGTSPLVKGIEKGSIGLLPLYAKHEIDLNQVVEGKSLLEWAIKHDRQDWVNGLIMEGADAASKNKNGQTPLEYAESFGGERTAIEDVLKKS